MATYDKETKFYWLQLKEDFFEDDAIEWLEEQQPNGRDYAYFYLKLCLKALKSNGILIRQVGNILIPYDNKKLAELTKIDFDTVTVAMELLKQIGLIQILENGEIYITQLENLIGSVSKGALKKQQQRFLKNQQLELEWTKSGQVSTKDKDKDKDKIKDKYIYAKNDDSKHYSLFDLFWEAYPKKLDKKKAKEKFNKINPDEQLTSLMIAQIKRFEETKEWKENNGKYIPYPSTWLNGRRWEDEIETEEEKEEKMLQRLKEKYGEE